MIKTFDNFHQEIPDERGWIKCPSDYQFEVGEIVKMSPDSKYIKQAKEDENGERIGHILGKNKGEMPSINFIFWKSPGNESTWYVKWRNGIQGCYYWREDLMINPKLNKEIKRKKEKYRDIDPYGEENWDD